MGLPLWFSTVAFLGLTTVLLALRTRLERRKSELDALHLAVDGRTRIDSLEDIVVMPTDRATELQRPINRVTEQPSNRATELPNYRATDLPNYRTTDLVAHASPSRSGHASFRRLVRLVVGGQRRDGEHAATAGAQPGAGRVRPDRSAGAKGSPARGAARHRRLLGRVDRHLRLRADDLEAPRQVEKEMAALSQRVASGGRR